MTCKLGNHSITCNRGYDPLKGLNSIVKNMQNEEYYIEYTEEDFNKLPEKYPVVAYNKKGKVHKKYVKCFLKFVSALQK